MIYSYHVERFIYYELLKFLPSGTLRDISNKERMKKLVTNDDLLLFFHFTRDARDLQRYFNEQGIRMFPDISVSLFIEDRIQQLEKLKPITRFNLDRKASINETGHRIQHIVPQMTSDRVVVKIGNYHQGKNKLLKRAGSVVFEKENVLFEQYVDNSRSIRILMITDQPEDIFIVEHINSDYINPGEAWLKNISPVEKVYSLSEAESIGIKNINDILDDALTIKKFLNHDYLGIDYVVSDTVTGLLEVNDMIGLPEDKRVGERAIAFFKNLSVSHLRK